MKTLEIYLIRDGKSDYQLSVSRFWEILQNPQDAQYNRLINVNGIICTGEKWAATFGSLFTSFIRFNIK